MRFIIAASSGEIFDRFVLNYIARNVFHPLPEKFYVVNATKEMPWPRKYRGKISSIETLSRNETLENDNALRHRSVTLTINAGKRTISLPCITSEKGVKRCIMHSCIFHQPLFSTALWLLQLPAIVSKMRGVLAVLGFRCPCLLSRTFSPFPFSFRALQISMSKSLGFDFEGNIFGQACLRSNLVVNLTYFSE